MHEARLHQHEARLHDPEGNPIELSQPHRCGHGEAGSWFRHRLSIISISVLVNVPKIAFPPARKRNAALPGEVHANNMQLARFMVFTSIR
jgi:hypothetical protein